MAKRNKRSRNNRARQGRLKKPRSISSYMNMETIYLNSHDEEKLLMFATGIILGVGLSATLLGIFIYGGIVLVVAALILIYVEFRQQQVLVPPRRR